MAEKRENHLAEKRENHLAKKKRKAPGRKKRKNHLAEERKKKDKTPGRKKRTNHLAEVALKEKSNPCATHCDHKDERALKYHIAILRISYYPLKSNHIHLKYGQALRTKYHIENVQYQITHVIHYICQLMAMQNLQQCEDLSNVFQS